MQALKQNYSVYAPKRFPKQGRYSDTDVIKYAEVEHYEDIVWQVKSDYPAKEVLTPIQQAIFYFTEDEYRASKGPKKPILILPAPATSTPSMCRRRSTRAMAAIRISIMSGCGRRSNSP